MYDEFPENNGQEIAEGLLKAQKDGEQGYYDSEQFEFAADWLQEQGRFEDSTKICEWGLRLHPTAAMLRVWRARASSFFGQFEFALEDLQAAEHLLPQDAEIQEAKGWVFARVGKLKEAQTALEKALDLNPEAEEARLQLARLHYETGHTEKALKYLRELLKINAENREAIREMLSQTDESKDFETLEVLIRQCIDETPFDAELWYLLAHAYVQLRQSDKAREALEYGLAADENFAPAYTLLGYLYMEADEYKKAQEALETAYKLEIITPELLCALGNCLQMQSETRQSLRYFQKAAKEFPTHAPAFYGVGEALLMLNQPIQAVYFLKKATKFSPDNALYWLRMGEAERNAGNPQAAITAFERSLALEPESPETYAEYAYLFFEEGQYEEGYDILAEGLHECPDEATLYFQAAAYLLLAGRVKAALVHLENALALEPDSYKQLFTFFDDVDTQKALFKLIKEIQG
jgi:tetratricopeptide (TPR) repeat protein